jgi:hypothetical protein
MSKPRAAVVDTCSRFLLLAALASSACLTKAPQYTEPPAIDARPGGRPGTEGAGGSGGPSTPGTAGSPSGAGGSSGTDGPASIVQVCGTSCEAEKSDGCCPVGCNGASDIDCAAQCGNAVLEKGEQCDPPTSCPAACPNRGCTRFTLQGSAGECTAICLEAGLESACKPDDGCCPPGCTVGDDNDCSIMCGNGVKEGSETCDPLSSCPTACLAQACQLRKLVNAGTCTAECVNDRLQTTCVAGDGCCPPGCHSANDADCQAACDNGVRESGETCDPLSACPTACPANECQLRKLTNPGTCKALCVDDRKQTTCQGGDDCCPPGCNSGNDSDCGIVCGNSIKESGETCDPLSSCPQSCPAMGCQLRELRNAGTCKATCENTRTQTACAGGDDCCPSACHNNNDSDCDPRCGNGVVERNETCEPQSECTRRQTACKSDRDNIRTGRGNPNQCTFECDESQRRCGDPDGQCPAHCNGNDPDCKRANGADCTAASQCLSNRCTDGRCCTEACARCEKCTGGGGTCQLPAGVRVCGNECKTINECCDSCNGQCQTCNPSMNRCVGTSGGACNNNTGTCRNGACEPNCMPARGCELPNQPCMNGRTDCNGTCQPAGPKSRNSRCAGGECDGQGSCDRCGNIRQRCCNNRTCPFGNDLACTLDTAREGGECVECGSFHGAPCCGDNNCKQGFSCFRSDGVCGECGDNAQDCCVNSRGPECKSGFVCRNALCEPSPCGEIGQPCCNSEPRCSASMCVFDDSRPELGPQCR